jgi:hypothetical protein
MYFNFIKPVNKLKWINIFCIIQNDDLIYVTYICDLLFECILILENFEKYFPLYFQQKENNHRPIIKPIKKLKWIHTIYMNNI